MLANVPTPTVFEKHSDTEIRAIDTTGASLWWFIRVTTEPASIWRWSPLSMMLDDTENGVLKPDALLESDPGRWIFQGWEGLEYAQMLT